MKKFSQQKSCPANEQNGQEIVREGREEIIEKHDVLL
jgi:hypothetical protein